MNGKTAADGDYLVDLKTVSNVQIFIPEQELKRVDTGAAHVTREYHIEPTFSVLVLNRAHNQRNTFSSVRRSPQPRSEGVCTCRGAVRRRQ